jgi:hypothetical protein
MNIATKFEDRVSSSPSTHEGEPSESLSDANIRLINRRSKLPRLLLALSSKNNKRNRNDKTSPTDWQTLTGHSISEI